MLFDVQFLQNLDLATGHAKFTSNASR